MFGLNWQLLIVVVGIAAAACVVGGRVWRLLRPGQSNGSCETCGSCSAATPPSGAEQPTAFVPLESLTPRPSADTR